MLESNRWIKIHRKILNWGWYTDANTFRVFMHLLLNASWEDTEYKGIKIPRGSLITGRKKISNQLKMTEQQVRTVLDHLKATNEITIKTTNKYSIITIVNYQKYQEKKQKITNKPTNNLTNKQPTSNQQATTYIEYIEYKNNRERENRERESDFVAPTLADIISYSKTLGVDDSEYCERFYNHYEAIGWINGSGHRIKKWKLIFNNWCKKDKKIKKQEKKTYIEFDENGELIEVER